MCASEGWGPPEPNADAFVVLARHQVIGATLGQALAAGAGFGDLVVHGYARVDNELVVAFLGRLGDLASFVWPWPR